ncbi:hypothetical protein GALMADRAFT_1279305 [Galerina marginata CBS 339.88]|uniref:Uncharacterized protein n=1 Tax=Galerina marginata (strain CBS 339.88) TaxID=685588 RepID=A0A067T981_GALM3|nr:hypothetical protein GALMADRAFT_1279305 [Galerina marginata CBS 339.88]
MTSSQTRRSTTTNETNLVSLIQPKTIGPIFGHISRYVLAPTTLHPLNILSSSFLPYKWNRLITLPCCLPCGSWKCYFVSSSRLSNPRSPRCVALVGTPLASIWTIVTFNIRPPVNDF